MFYLYTPSKLSHPYFKFSLKVMKLNPGYLLRSFLLYHFVFKSLTKYFLALESFTKSIAKKMFLKIMKKIKSYKVGILKYGKKGKTLKFVWPQCVPLSFLQAIDVNLTEISLTWISVDINPFSILTYQFYPFHLSIFRICQVF